MRPRFRRRRRRGRFLLFLLLLPLLAVGLLWWQPQLALEAEFARQRWQADAVERDVEVGGVRWRYLETGAGEPLLLVHGFTGSKENWLPVMAELGAHFRVIAPDLPGWGESQRDAGADYGFRAQAERLADFIARVAPEQPVRLVGHSMGGGVAAVYAGQGPASMQRLVLMDAAGVPFDNDFSRRVGAGEHPFEVIDAVTLARQIDLVFTRKPWIPWPADSALIAQRSAQVDFERSVLAQIAGNEGQAYAPAVAAQGISVPTLLLWCREDRVIDRSAADEYAKRIRHAQLALLDGCNHMPMMELPADTARTLLDFLRAPLDALPRS
ncbi:alpha/beta fold hydrolase [Pseudomarimonas salicorniae]|uniref:Alpha/beta fold hydrolase n=1 Tax=Pseudomarimonas salicorniae TaxID=2933270 RepID=A0ABT0GCK9_9GAMM|nr:alpha/beta fold hydrolase [Lysobacter sp. CAU 1642]MCK7592261.1 alpha/beta fold hydrolase [Lysobacter sp. CAU 1642]